MSHQAKRIPSLDDVTPAEWRRLAGRRVFFAHQSVGGNVLEGVADVLRERPELGLRVVEEADPSRMAAPALYHARIGQNTRPQTKLDQFCAIAAGLADDGDMALVKYCYVDVTGGTDPAALFATYRDAVAALRAARPSLTVVHVTLPLETDWGTYFHWKRTIRGKLTTHRELNRIRGRYNELMRREFAGREPIVDLAWWQSIGADGLERTVRYRFSRVPILAREWTYDGGHLNEPGRRRIAEAFLATLATH